MNSTRSISTSRWLAAVTDFPPLELVQFFGTNYHYRQPELDENTVFALHVGSGCSTSSSGRRRAVSSCGPSCSARSRCCCCPRSAPTVRTRDGFTTLDLARLAAARSTRSCSSSSPSAGATCVQLDEPSFTEDRTPRRTGCARAAPTTCCPTPRCVRASSSPDRTAIFGEALPILAASKVEAIGLDLVYGTG